MTGPTTSYRRRQAVALPVGLLGGALELPAVMTRDQAATWCRFLTALAGRSRASGSFSRLVAARGIVRPRRPP